MKILAFFDISAFIWDKQHFESNKSGYYNLMNVLPYLYDEIKKNNISVIFRGELLQEIQYYFPYDTIPNDYYDFQRMTLSFLTGINMVDYPSIDEVQMTHLPNLIKDFYKKTTQCEVKYLLSYVYSEANTSKLLTFSIFWNGNNKLSFTNGDSTKEIDAHQCDNLENHERIILSLKKVFDHNSKHDKYKSSNLEFYGRVISSLSCYNERNGDKTDAQRLLDSAIYFKGDFFNYDYKNSTYVMFVNTVNNIYHGFNFQPNEQDKALIDNALKNEQ